MPSFQQVSACRIVQNAAKAVLQQLPHLLDAHDTESSIATKALQLLSDAGYPNTWYYDCPVLVLLGSRSCLSVSGKYYQASEEKIGGKNLVSIDLSPLHHPIWGDYSRTFAFEFGVYVVEPKTLEYKNGLQFQKQLHREMMQWVKPSTSFHSLFNWANVRIRESGFVNLDFRSNVGHSIAPELEERQFIQLNNHTLLGEVDFFSFEPFVRLKGGNWGFKQEDIYFFDESGNLALL